MINKNKNKKELVDRYFATSANTELRESSYCDVFYLDENNKFIGISEYSPNSVDNTFVMIRPIKNFFYKEKNFGLKFVLIMHYLKNISGLNKTLKTGAEPVGGMKKYVFNTETDKGFIGNDNFIDEKRLQNYINNTDFFKNI